MATVNAGTYTLGPSHGTVRVKTLRDGMAAKIGHDLIIEVAKWSATVTVPAEGDGSSAKARATFDAGSLEVKEGTGGAMALSSKDIGEIQKNTAEKVLQASRHPEITFEATRIQESGGGVQVDGQLTIAGTQRPVSFRLDLDQSNGAPRVTGTVPITQTDFGIKPYKALMGALKVRDQIEVCLDVRIPS